MKRYVAFLRAVNVGGHAIVRMSDLRGAFAAARCENVRTYIQSGNVLFDLPEDKAQAVLKNIPLKLRELLGKEPGVLYRTDRDLEKLAAAAPFQDAEPDPETKRYVTFLAQKPRRKPALPLHSVKEAIEVVALTNQEAFIISRRKPNGMFGFPNECIEKELGVAATTRNWNTITKIIKLFSAGG
jgi:uncharacterized protein (DUF1697 family)